MELGSLCLVVKVIKVGKQRCLGMYGDGYADGSLKREHVSSILIQLQRLWR